MTLLTILGATLAGGVLSVLIAALLSMTVLRRIAGKLVGFAVGVLLAAALLELLPEALAELSAPRVGGVLLAGLLGFFFLEKLALWRHDHGGGSDATATLIVLGDGVHNFVDGVLLAAAFLQDPLLGMTTAAAVIAHEIPQEIGDFMVLLAVGVSRPRALALNALSGAAMVAGGVIGFAALQAVTGAVPYLLALAAASFLYLATADLVPLLQRERRGTDFAEQLLVLLLGVGVVLAGSL
ncbi:ZIP family metal transporter [Immundisolibacter sp.]|uniref:ZIP family metal transporter n=1 Tax=Immundisolibacter sp. TaxID=1934948 RepID=UPI00262B2D51|nr:ZIP family metal transporter [Immundisolibacter sp.]MDD3649928.1 ZIP family metal transporter [Immundisolibacter sp.]